MQYSVAFVETYKFLCPTIALNNQMFLRICILVQSLSQLLHFEYR